jgi:hypothetical protein
VPGEGCRHHASKSKEKRNLFLSQSGLISTCNST